MIIIGHRGAAGILPENTVASVMAAVKAGVDMIEFDARVTKDNKIVVFHDGNLQRIAGLNKAVDEMTLAELTATETNSGYPIPSIQEVMQAAKDVPVLVDCKGRNWSVALYEALKDYPSGSFALTAVDTQEMFRFREHYPSVKTYVSEFTKPFEGIYKASLLGFTGISLNFWVLNPLAYYYAKRKNLKFMIFTVNSKLLARFLDFFYPEAAIITNVPDKLLKHAKNRHKKQAGLA